MPAEHATYRALLRLYPRRFREEFGPDMVRLFADLAARDGTGAAWRRTLWDLCVTVPRYRLETIMSTHNSQSSIPLLVLVGVLALAAVAAFAMGLPVAAAIAAVLATVIVLADRSRLARSLRPQHQSQRRRLWRVSGICAAVAAAVLVVGMADLGGRDHWPTGRLLVYNSLFFLAAIGAVVTFLTGCLRPRGN